MGKTIDQLAYHIEWLEPGELKPYSANSKLHSEKNVANIANSIARYGWQQNVTITKDREIIIGHGRQLAALRLGVKVPCKVIEDDLTEDDIRELRIADNLTHDGEYDWEAMNAEIEQFGLEFEGFDFDFGDGIEEEQVEEPEPGEVEEDDYDEELPEEPKVKLGDLYMVGRHRILCGDSTMLGDVERLMDGAKADMLLTDPPYNVDYNAKEARLMKYRVNERFSEGKQVNIKNDAMDDDSFRQFLADAFSNADMVMKPGAAFYIWHPVMQTYNFLGALRDMGWNMKQILVWVKNNFTIGKADYQWKHENCQPAGTMVLTPNGEVPIESLRDGDKVVSYFTMQNEARGFRNGLEVQTAHRHYDGLLYGVCVDGRKTWATNNHQFSVKFNRNPEKPYCNYLMRRGNWWRVGVTRPYDARGFCVKHRFDQEHADAAWIIDTYNTWADAQMGEQMLAVKYGIPYTRWVVKDKIATQRTDKQVEWLYDMLDLDVLCKNAVKLLHDYGRDINYPLITKENKRDAFSRRVTVKVNACNLIPNLMLAPVLNADESVEFKPIDAIETKRYSGEVYSLAVDKYEHYIADGIITHNCIYGWKLGAEHLWASDRKQTSVINWNKPLKNDIHPTMKPIGLFDYCIRNNTKGGDIVLDLFGGSCTTIMACEQDGRIGYCAEIEPKYVQAAIQRFIKFTGKDDEVFLIRDGQKIPCADMFADE